ncbi:RNA-directed DNA polymerase, eukaryota [Tanacetum coccineum]
MFKKDLEPLAPRLLQNKEAHKDYLKYTQKQADILWEIVKLAKAKQPLDKDLDFACMFKLDLVPLPPRLLQNREVHINYLRNTQEQANILREIVEQVKAKQPLDGDLDLAWFQRENLGVLIDERESILSYDGISEGLVSNTQSAFVAGRQILDGPFILNEVLDWCKRKKKKALFFKVDFAKAYDSVRWDFLLDVLEAFGFGSTWCTWIRGISDFAKASLLVNGSPSDEGFIFIGVLNKVALLWKTSSRYLGVMVGAWDDSS